MATDNNDDRDDRTIFVGNLSEKVSEEILYELFYQAGPIERVSIPKDKETERQKNFGFITYKYQMAIDYALNIFAGTKLYERELLLKYRNSNRNREQQQSQQQMLLNHQTHQQNSFSSLQNPMSSLMGMGGLGGLNPLALAIGDFNPQSMISSAQQKLMFLAASSDGMNSNPFQMEEYPSMRRDTSGSQRDRFVDRNRYHRDDDRNRSRPYRRSRSRSPVSSRYSSHNKHNARDRSNDRSGNYHRWGKR